MPAKKKHTYTEEDLQKALELISSGAKFNSTCKDFGIPTSTVRSRMKGCKSWKDRDHTVLGKEEEGHLTQWISESAKRGFGKRSDAILSTVQSVLNSKGLKTRFKDNKPGAKWLKLFKDRNNLSQRTPLALGFQRAAVTEEKILSWFQQAETDIRSLSEDVLDDPSRIFNADESGFQLGGGVTRVIAPKRQKLYQVTSDTHRQVTVLVCGSAAGNFLRPLLIFPGKRFAYDPLYGFNDSDFARSDNGWIDSTVFEQWFEHCFVEQTKDLRKPVLLFVDGHASHLTLKVHDLAIEHQVIVYQLPSHASHIVQPLDLTVFKKLKTMWKRVVSDHQEETTQPVTKETFARVFKKAWPAAEPESLISGFECSGLFPWNPQRFDRSKLGPSAAFIPQPPPPIASTSVAETMPPPPMPSTSVAETVPSTATASMPAPPMPSDDNSFSVLWNMDFVTEQDFVIPMDPFPSNSPTSQLHSSPIQSAQPITSTPKSSPKSVLPPFLSTSPTQSSAQPASTPKSSPQLILPPFPPASPTQSSVQPPTSTPKASPQLVLPPFPSTSPSQQPPDNTSSSSPQPVPISIDHSYVQSASTRQYSDQEAFDRVLLLAANAGLAKLFSYQSKYAEGQRSSEDLEEQQFFRLYSQLMLRFQTPPPTNPPPTPAPSTPAPSFQNLSLPARAPTVRQRKLTLMPPKLLNCPAFKDFKLDSQKKKDVKEAKKERTQAKKQEKIRNEIIKSFIEENETVPKRKAAKKTVKKADESVEVHFGEGVKKRRKTGDAACEGCEGKKRFRDWVSCETCSRWFHLSVFCTKDNTLKGKSVKDLKDVAWMCKSCC